MSYQVVTRLKEAIILLQRLVWLHFSFPVSSFSFHSVLTPVPLTLKESIQGHRLSKETSTRAREAGSLTNQPMGLERELLRERSHFFWSTRVSSLALCQTPLTLQAPSLAPFPRLSYVVAERQHSSAPPRELQASVTLS